MSGILFKPGTGRTILRALLLLLFPAALLMQYFAAKNPHMVECFYSRGFYRGVSSAVSKYFNLFPFSCSEIILYAAAIFALFVLIVVIKNIFQKNFKQLPRFVLTAALVIAPGYFVFTLIWGLNYCRVPLEELMGYKTGTPTVAELSAIMRDETDAINSLSLDIQYNKNGRSHYANGFKKISEEAAKSYKELAKQGALQNELFGGQNARPKGILASKLLSYTGITGIYIPFTCEPNVDTDMPDFAKPFVAAHESAHFKGFAREQEANFCAYLACTASDDLYFQYSAHMEAYIYISNALFQADNDAWRKEAARLGKNAAGDFKYYNEYYKAHEGRVSKASDKVNDAYLKSQGQKGVVSYDLFVTLLADKYRTK
jgi:hypothetical protein